MLFDTGLGIGNIQAVVRELWDRELIVVNSHCHFDHVGGNWQFGTVYGVDLPLVRNLSACGLDHEVLKKQVTPPNFIHEAPADFDAAVYQIKPYHLEPLEEGMTFELGGRDLVCWFTPGHSEDGVMLYDTTRRILFSGDTLYLGRLFAFFDDPFLGHSDMADYEAGVRAVLEMCPDVEHIYASHNAPEVPVCKLQELADGLTAINGGQLEGILAPMGDYSEEPADVRIYQFEGFSVLCRE